MRGINGKLGKKIELEIGEVNKNGEMESFFYIEMMKIFRGFIRILHI